MADSSSQKNNVKNRRSIKSVEIGMTILQNLSQAGRPLSLNDICELCQLSPSKVHLYLASFINTGFVKQSNVGGWYDLDKEALTLGLEAMSRIDVVQRAAEAMPGLTGEVGLTSHLSVLGQSGPVITNWQRTSPPLITSLAVGAILPIVSSATGNIFLSYSPSGSFSRLVASELKLIQKANLRNELPRRMSEVKKLIHSVRKQNLAWAVGTAIPGLMAVAGPVFDSNVELKATITLISSDAQLLAKNSNAANTLLSVCRKVSLAWPSVSL